jgi:hypothetical protein
MLEAQGSDPKLSGAIAEINSFFSHFKNERSWTLIKGKKYVLLIHT